MVNNKPRIALWSIAISYLVTKDKKENFIILET